MYVWQIPGLKLLTPSIRLNSRHISATVIDTCMKRCQSKLKKDLAVLTWRDSWREKHCAYAHAHGSVLRTCTHNTARSKWAVVEKLYIYHLETHFTLYVCVFFTFLNSSSLLWCAMKSMLTPNYFSFFFSLPQLSPKSFDHFGVKKGQLVSSVPGRLVTSLCASALSQTLAHIFMIKAGRG